MDSTTSVGYICIHSSPMFTAVACLVWDTRSMILNGTILY